jgi:hypothetical protein
MAKEIVCTFATFGSKGGATWEQQGFKKLIKEISRRVLRSTC